MAKDEHSATQHQEATTPPKAPAAKLADDFVPNEPYADKDGKPADRELSPKQLERAAVEALHSLRPQPTAGEITHVLDRLAEVDEKHKPRVVVKSAKEAGEKAVALLNERSK
jgi:hypothetical protein